MNKGPVSQFIQHHYRHFNAAALVDAAKGYETHLLEGGKMMVTLAGAMSTGELGISLAEMIRQGKVDIISCTGANLEEDVMNLVLMTQYFDTLKDIGLSGKSNTILIPHSPGGMGDISEQMRNAIITANEVSFNTTGGDTETTAETTDSTQAK